MELKDLEKYRDENGCIDFDRVRNEIGLDLFSPTQELRGTQTREKLWLHFDDDTVLLKTVEDNTNLEGTCYAEMIISELAKQAGFEAANIDLIRYNGRMGIISSKVNKKGEQLHSLREYIGDEDIPDDPAPEITGLDFVFNNMVNYLKNTNLGKSEKYALLQTLMKLMVFDVLTLNIDRHPENISFIERMGIDGKKEMVLSPLYDNEFSLMLEMSHADLSEYLKDSRIFYYFADAEEPKIAPKYEGMEEKRPCHWINLLNTLCDMDDTIFDYTLDLIDSLDIRKAIQNVESRIGAQIPNVYKDAAYYSFTIRKKEVRKELFKDTQLDVPIDDDKHDELT